MTEYRGCFKQALGSQQYDSSYNIAYVDHETLMWRLLFYLSRSDYGIAVLWVRIDSSLPISIHRLTGYYHFERFIMLLDFQQSDFTIAT